MSRPDEGLSEVSITFRAPESLREAAAKAAHEQGVPVSEWWREAARARLRGGSDARRAAANGDAGPKTQGG